MTNEAKKEAFHRLFTSALVRVIFSLNINYFIKRNRFTMVYFKHTDMTEPCKSEAMQLCVRACQQFPDNNQVRINTCNLA